MATRSNTTFVEVKFDAQSLHTLQRVANALEKIANEPQPAILLDKSSVAAALRLESDG